MIQSSDEFHHVFGRRCLRLKVANNISIATMRLGDKSTRWRKEQEGDKHDCMNHWTLPSK